MPMAGGIYNSQSRTVGTITGDFTGNYASADLHAMGGGIYNSRYATIAGISGDFNSNYVNTDTQVSQSTNNRSQGGAIYNEGAITNGITDSTFTGNYAIANEGAAQGGAIYHSGYSSYKINNISADFLITTLLRLIIRRKAELFTIHIVLVAVPMVLVMYPVILSGTM